MLSCSTLQRGDRERIHDLAQRLLEETGIIVHYPPARQVLLRHGAIVDEARHLVRLPRRLVSEALATAPHAFTMHSHSDGLQDLALGGGGKCYARTGTGLNWIIDHGSKFRRPVTGKDLENWVQVSDNLTNVHMVGALYDQEGMPQAMDVRAVSGMLRLTRKPLMISALSGEGMRWVKRLIEVVQPAHCPHRVMVLSSVNSPLTYGFGQAEVAMVSAELAIPVVVNSSAVSGASAPVTLAGALMQMHAEMLAAVAIIQLHRPGAAVMYAGHPVVMDMRAGTAAMGTPEGGLLAAGCIEIGQHCGLPTGSDGLTSDSCTADALAVADKWASAFLAVLAGANMNGAAGVIGTQSTVSLEQLVIDDDIYGAMFRQQRGLAVDDDRLALPVIARVGHNGQFVTDNHTFSHYRSEVWYPRVANRMDAPTWEASGAKDAAERARDIVHDILATPQEQFLAPEQLREINTLVMEAEKVLASVKTPM